MKVPGDSLEAPSHFSFFCCSSPRGGMGAIRLAHDEQRNERKICSNISSEIPLLE